MSCKSEEKNHEDKLAAAESAIIDQSEAEDLYAIASSVAAGTCAAAVLGIGAPACPAALAAVAAAGVKVRSAVKKATNARRAYNKAWLQLTKCRTKKW